MHLVKSHRLQHFMKMHAEKKHKCSKCSNSYGTEWDLRRHAEDCGKTFQCTCGCPYASRTALQSHVYRTGHEIPAEHRDPPSKKRKMENCLHNQKLSSKTVESLSNQQTPRPDTQELETSEIKLVASFEDSCNSTARKQTLTTPPSSKVTSSIAAQTDAFIDACFQSGGISRETQTSGMRSPTDDRVQMDQAVMCGDIFESVHSSYGVSADSIISSSLVTETVTHGLLPQNHPKTLHQDIEKSTPVINFSAQNSLLPSQNMTDNQTQTIDLLSDLENILSSNLPGQTLDNRSLLSDTNSGPDSQLPSGPTQNPAIDFDIEEFFSASNIQTQTEESELSTMTTEPVLESLDIETQTDFLLADTSAQSYGYRGNSNFLGLEMFDTQTQTDLNFFLDSSPHLPLGSILKHSSFSMSTDSSDTETQTEGISTAKNIPALESKVQLNSTETQTMNSGFETLGSLFFTSNETQTAMDDFLLADLAWNTMESQFSSVETQTCAELHTVSNF
ncbi:ATM interactor [Camelus dromedarius]|uniref:ATM interactor n=1 Tax=Camelus dromedarius TaxID=9838 RepID=A0A5N4DTK7_CAMDR|nr:ATM interactor [Camelus dromedarius]